MVNKTYLKTSLAIVAISVLAQLTFAASPRYEVIDLGTLPGCDLSNAYSINNIGQVVGNSYPSTGNSRATLFDPTGGGNNTDLGILPGANRSYARSISNNAQIVGVVYYVSEPHRAVLFDSTGQGNNVDLGTLPGYDYGFANSINDSGQIVGIVYNVAGVGRATLFDSSGGCNNIDLGTLPGGNYSSAKSINNSGQIVGKASADSGIRYATLFDFSGGGNNINLGTLPGGGMSEAYSINGSGQIVGYAYVSGHPHASRFDPSGGGNNIDLGALPGGDYSEAYCINNREQIVGWSRDASGDSHATMFDPTGGGNNVDLNLLIDPALSWTLTYAYSINDNGYIAGYGFDPAGQHNAYLLIPKPSIIYVDADANGANDGSSWADAFNYLQDALSVAYSGDEIRVAQGTYKPDQGAAVTPGDREATFQLKNGVTIKGGYAGCGEPDPNSHDIDAYETILTGDLNGDDVAVNDPCDLWAEPTKAENSYHVVTGTGTDITAVLDGFTITGGNANGPHDPYRFEYGGGMYCNLYSSPTVINCTFRGNMAGGGGGLYIYWDNNMVLTNCAFIGNYAGNGGGMKAMRSRAKLTNCAFSGNAARNGGGMSNDDGGPTLTNCTFSANSAAGSGGGIDNFMSSPTLTNCTLTGNSAERGGAINSFLECTTMVTNSILWANTAAKGSQICLEDDPHYSSDASIGYCNVEGGITGVYVGEGWRFNWGQGNIDSDPLFRDPDGNDNIPGTEDDNLRLSAASLCIDAGDPNYVAGPNETDLDGKPRVIGGRIDMGAYESPVPAEVRIVPRIINLASEGKWITCYISLPEDYNVADIDPNSVLLDNAVQAASLKVDEEQQVAVVRFSRSEVQAILNASEVELTITGQLTNGTIFEGTDVIRVKDKGGKNIESVRSGPGRHRTRNNE